MLPKLTYFYGVMWIYMGIYIHTYAYIYYCLGLVMRGLISPARVARPNQSMQYSVSY